ncbi:hypothetical protein BDA96_01G324400 [Sorghum bicolor]|uniref:Uncharacterized protein n=2 Tax=Sorghum bicolor TaxID=4558 RepID=A0A921S272_SORBI|nr:hypothetical protein SORBI_3001G300100 [Sorghum bicolor]KAG0550261.1 hypothetical protein BDA96_01G324400 [Sorghum bicolor]
MELHCTWAPCGGVAAGCSRVVGILDGRCPRPRRGRPSPAGRHRRGFIPQDHAFSCAPWNPRCVSLPLTPSPSPCQLPLSQSARSFTVWCPGVLLCLHATAAPRDGSRGALISFRFVVST